jgi:hypothetical protein
VQNQAENAPGQQPQRSELQAGAGRR